MKVRNPKTGRVLKNPELFIRRLQHDLMIAETHSGLLLLQNQKLKGKVLVEWRDHIKSQHTTNSNNLFALNPGDRIAIVGKVLSVKGSKCSGGNRESEIEYTVLQTRRMPQGW